MPRVQSAFPIAELKASFCKARVSLVVYFFLVFLTVLNWQKVTANRSKKRYCLGKALGLLELLDLFWFYTHTHIPLLL